MKPLPPLARLQELLAYDPEEGVLRWRETRGTRWAGQVAGRVTNKGYRQITIDYLQYQAHRIAYALHHGCDPHPLTIDHIDRDKCNNRIANLRAVTHSVNAYNRHNQAAINKRRPVTITYPDGGTLTTRTYTAALYILGTHPSRLSRALRNDGILYNANGRTPTGITVCDACHHAHT